MGGGGDLFFRVRRAAVRMYPLLQNSGENTGAAAYATKPQIHVAVPVECPISNSTGNV